MLEGTFSDKNGDYPAGTYVRNPVGSKHRPASEGAVRFWSSCGRCIQMIDDQQRVVVDTRQTSCSPDLIDGLKVMPLHSYGTEQVALVRWALGTQFQRHTHYGGEEILLLEGCWRMSLAYPPGTWLRNSSGRVIRRLPRMAV